MICSNNYHDLECCERLANLLTEELQTDILVSNYPKYIGDIEDILKLILEEMSDLSIAISDYKLADKNFETLDEILIQMFVLSKKAANNKMTDNNRQKSDHNFQFLAKKIAQLGAKNNFPFISIQSLKEAQRAQKILAKLNENRLSFYKYLNEQKELITKAVKETINLLIKIALTPGADPLNKISTLLTRIDFINPLLKEKSRQNQH